MVNIAGQQFSAKAAAFAQRRLRNKALGRRGNIQDPFNPSRPLSESELAEGNRAVRALFSIPANRRAIGRAAEFKATVAFEKKFGVRAPTRAERLAGQSLPDQIQTFARPSDLRRIQTPARPEDLGVKRKLTKKETKEGFLRGVEVGKRLSKKGVPVLPLSQLEIERQQRKLEDKREKRQERLKRFGKKIPKSLVVFTPEIKATFKVIQIGGDKISKFFKDTSRDIREDLDPEEKQLRLESEKQLQRFLDQQAKLEKDFDKFNNKFGDKKLSQSQFDVATKEQKELALRQDVLNKNSQVFSSEFNKVVKNRPENTKAFIREFSKQVITIPLTAGILAVGLTTRPVKTTKEAVSGFGGLPSELKARPFTTTGSIAGQVAGFKLLGVGTVRLKKIVSKKNINSSGVNFIVTKKPKKKKKISTISEIFPKRIKFEISDVKVSNYLKNEFKKRGGDFSKLNKTNQEFLIGQVKVRIRNNPDLFLSPAVKITLKKAKIKNLRSFTRRRLEGKFDKPFTFTKISKKVTPNLTRLQTSTFKQLKKQAEKDAIRRAIKKGRQKLKASDLLSKSEIDFIQSKLRVALRADPTKAIPKTRRIAIKRLEAIERKLESKEAIKTAIQKGKQKLTLSDLLSKSEIAFVKKQVSVVIKTKPRKSIPKVRQETLKRLDNIQEKLRIKKAIKEGRKDKALPLSKVEKELIDAQLTAQIRAGPAQFIPKARQQVLLQLQKPKKPKRKKPEFKVIAKKPTELQLLALSRLKKQQAKVSSSIKQVQKQQVKAKRTQQTLSNQLQKEKTKLKKTKQVLQQRQKQSQKQRRAEPKSKTKEVLKQRSRLISRVVLVSQQVQKQQVRVQQLERQAQRPKLRFRQLQQLKFAQSIKQRQLQKQLQKLKKVPRTIQKLKPPKLIIIPPPGLRRKITRQASRKKPNQGYNVFARPLKRKGQKKRPKLVKLNISPLGKTNAKRLGSTLVDTTLSRTFKIRKVKSKPKKLRVRVNPFPPKKFRTFRIIKGKKVPLKNVFIERKGKALIDTAGEKRGLTLRRGLKQLRVRSRIVQRPKPLIRSPSKRKVSQKVLNNLAKGRKIRMQNLKKRK